MADDIDISVAVSAIGLLKLLLRYIMLLSPCKVHSNGILLNSKFTFSYRYIFWGRGLGCWVVCQVRRHLIITY